MKKRPARMYAVAHVLTLASIATWMATGLHPYTKYEEITRVKEPAPLDDPFAEAGLYDGEAFRTVRKRVVYFGLLPTPQRLFDKHVFSVLSVVLPVWSVVGSLALIQRRRRRLARQAFPRCCCP